MKQYPWGALWFVADDEQRVFRDVLFQEGCNLALMDAHALARALERATSAQAAGELYTESRRRHLARYQFATRWLTLFFQSDYALLGHLRDIFLPPSCAIPWVGRQMVESMCGVSLGPFEAPLPLPSDVVKKGATSPNETADLPLVPR